MKLKKKRAKVVRASRPSPSTDASVGPEGHLRTAYLALGRVVEDASSGSALRGLEVASMAFAMLLDVYAKPNDLNPEGMCDDAGAFRRYFADIIASGADGLS